MTVAYSKTHTLFHPKPLATGCIAFAVIALWIFFGSLDAHSAEARSAQNLSVDEIRQAVSQVLVQRHPTDTPQWWRDLGPQAPPVIMQMIRETDRTTVRTRLILALGAFDDPEVTAFLKEQALGAGESVLQRTAVEAVARSQGDRELEFVSRFLQNPDSLMRMAAARSIRNMKSERAREIFERYLTQEKTPGIVDRLKGLTPTPVPAPAISNANESVSADWIGTWRGYWVEPAAKSALGGPPKGMATASAFIKFERSGGAPLTGELVLKKSALILQNPMGKGQKLKGVFAPKGPMAGTHSFAFDAEVVEQAGAWILRAVVPAKGATLILRRDPP